VHAAHERLSTTGLPTATEDEVTCCFALQDKVWVDGPDDRAWEIYTVLADADTETINGDALCCTEAAESAARCC
jgi:hypothetical protein